MRYLLAAALLTVTMGFVRPAEAEQPRSFCPPWCFDATDKTDVRVKPAATGQHGTDKPKLEPKKNSPEPAPNKEQARHIIRQAGSHGGKGDL